VRGTSSGEVMLEHIMSDNPVQVGEEVRTSGGDRIFPKGLPVGTVKEVNPGSDLFLNIRVRPAANLNKLEEVLVVTKLVEQEPAQLDAGQMKAVDILAQRLPSVPDKQAAAEAAKTQPPAATPASTSAPVAASKSASQALPKAAEANLTKPKEKAEAQATAAPPKPITATPTASKPASVAPSPLKPATEHGPAPAPVQVANPNLPGAKPKAPPAAQPTQTPDGPQ